MAHLSGSDSIRLQGIGWARAIPASELEVGMLLSWNYSPLGYEVISVRNVSRMFVELVERNRENGNEYTRRLKKDRLVAAEAATTRAVLCNESVLCPDDVPRPCVLPTGHNGFHDGGVR